jgi:hypothetical protein
MFLPIYNIGNAVCDHIKNNLNIKIPKIIEPSVTKSLIYPVDCKLLGQTDSYNRFNKIDPLPYYKYGSIDGFNDSDARDDDDTKHVNAVNDMNDDAFLTMYSNIMSIERSLADEYYVVYHATTTDWLFYSYFLTIVKHLQKGTDIYTNPLLRTQNSSWYHDGKLMTSIPQVIEQINCNIAKGHIDTNNKRYSNDLNHKPTIGGVSGLIPNPPTIPKPTSLPSIKTTSISKPTSLSIKTTSISKPTSLSINPPTIPKPTSLPSIKTTSISKPTSLSINPITLSLPDTYQSNINITEIPIDTAETSSPKSTNNLDALLYVTEHMISVNLSLTGGLGGESGESTLHYFKNKYTNSNNIALNKILSYIQTLKNLTPDEKNIYVNKIEACYDNFIQNILIDKTNKYSGLNYFNYGGFVDALSKKLNLINLFDIAIGFSQNHIVTQKIKDMSNIHQMNGTLNYIRDSELVLDIAYNFNGTYKKDLTIFEYTKFYDSFNDTMNIAIYDIICDYSSDSDVDEFLIANKDNVCAERGFLYKTEYIQEILSRFKITDPIPVSDEKSIDNSVILQILIKKTHVDDCLLITVPFGFPLNIKASEYLKLMQEYKYTELTNALSNMINIPDDKFSIDGQRTKELMEKFQIDLGKIHGVQGRLFNINEETYSGKGNVIINKFTKSGFDQTSKMNELFNIVVDFTTANGKLPDKSADGLCNIS